MTSGTTLRWSRARERHGSGDANRVRRIAAVTLADIDGAAIEQVRDQLVAAGHQALAVRGDVSDEADVAAMVSTTVSTFGRLDAAFNGAGVQSPATDAADESARKARPVQRDQPSWRVGLH